MTFNFQKVQQLKGNRMFRKAFVGLGIISGLISLLGRLLPKLPINRFIPEEITKTHLCKSDSSLHSEYENFLSSKSQPYRFSEYPKVPYKVVSWEFRDYSKTKAKCFEIEITYRRLDVHYASIK